MIVQTAKRLFNVDEYYAMARAGIFSEDDRVELIEGEIIEMSPIGINHASVVARLTHLFTEKIGKRAIVWVQNPIHLGKRSEPQPDLSILHPRADFYAEYHPEPKDIFVVIEVSESSAEFDRTTKAALYARSGIVQYMLVDLEDNSVSVQRNPTASGYADSKKYGRGQKFSLDIDGAAEFAVNEILG
ncbi:MAG: Uma2 family endonuclease [Chloroflexi bacterium]|nr:Uma2 family endonuclease [Chloroflexota bacterium]MBI3741471.1 Uma2 family endonuclease [Chloroflexota bacterium]